MKSTLTQDWQAHLSAAQNDVASLTQHLAMLNEMRDAATVQILALGRGAGVALNTDAVKACIDKPYVLCPTGNPSEWKVITWRGRADVPIIGWPDYQDDAFIVSTINRGIRLVSAVPEWMQKTIGWQPPQFSATLNPTKTIVQVTQGDPTAFLQRFKPYLAGSADGGFRIRSGKAWIELLQRMLEDGIVPHTPRPVDPKHWNANADCAIVLRPYQQGYVDQFRRDGSETIVLASGGGKTFIALYLIAHLVGHQYIFCDSDLLCGQWRARLKEYAPHADVEVMTFQAAVRRIAKLHGIFALTDEGHRLPAATWSRLAFADVTYKASMTATPWRLERQSMIFALGGPPRLTPWKELLDLGAINRPKVQVVQVPNAAFKLQWLKKALAAHPTANTLIYCDSIQYGKHLASALDLPFIFGDTPNKFERVLAARQRIVSKAIEASLDLPDLDLIIEVDVSHTGRSPVSAGQRIGRAMHSRKRCEYFLLLTADEYTRFGVRLVGIEMQLGDVIDYVDLTGQGLKSLQVNSRTRRTARRSRQGATVKPGDEASVILATPAIRRLILDEEKSLGATRQGYAAKAFRVLWKWKAGTSNVLRLKEGKSAKAWEPWQAGLNALVRAGLVKLSAKVYTLNLARINELCA